MLSPDACTSVADDPTSNKLHDFLQDLWHWHIHDLLPDEDSARSRGTCCTPSKFCGKRTATICSTLICSQLVTGHGTRRTQHHNVCHDVHRAPCESHDNLSEDVADASNQPHSQVDRSEKSVCLAKMCEIHKARLLQACSPGAPPTPMTGCYDFRRAWRPTPGQWPWTSACRPRHSSGSPPRLRGHPAGSVLSRSLLSKWQFSSCFAATSPA